MGKKTITMSYDDYQMMSVENEMHKGLYDKLKDEKMVYLTIIDQGPLYTHQGPRYSHNTYNQISGQIVEKDELLKKMQENLKEAEERMKELEANYKRRIERLEEDFYKALSRKN